MIDHIGIGVSDLARSRAYYEQALAPLGYEFVMAVETAAGFGRDGKPNFWIYGGRENPDPVHVAITVDRRSVVDEYHAAALAAGGEDNGAPGIRIYHPNYYGAFVKDPDGHNIEAVCHLEE